MNISTHTLEVLHKFLFPKLPNCAVCNKVLFHKNTIYCDECENKLEWIKGKRCQICSRQISPLSQTMLCQNCIENKNYFKKGYSLWNYDKYSKLIIMKIKYKGCEGLATELGKLLYSKTKDLDFIKDTDIIIPVPSDAQRFKKRGYNQALLIAKGFSQEAKKPLKDNILFKKKSTKDQIGLTKQQRKENLIGAFDIKNSYMLKSKNILLIDDVLTTSSTLNEISRVLSQNNTKNIYFLTLASKKNDN